MRISALTTGNERDFHINGFPNISTNEAVYRLHIAALVENFGDQGEKEVITKSDLVTGDSITSIVVIGKGSIAYTTKLAENGKGVDTRLTIDDKFLESHIPFA